MIVSDRDASGLIQTIAYGVPEIRVRDDVILLTVEGGREGHELTIALGPWDMRESIERWVRAWPDAE